MAKSIVLIEHEEGRPKSSSLRSIAAAHRLDDDYALLALGDGLAELASSLVHYGASAVLLVDDPFFRKPLADRYAAAIARVVSAAGAETIVAASSTFTKDILPRTAALLGWPMLSDLIAIEADGATPTYRRPICSGAAIATVKLLGDRRVLTVRPAAFAAAAVSATESDIQRVSVDLDSLPSAMEFVSQEKRRSDRPELTEARVVVSGGRPLRDEATFERLVGRLADTLGGAVGSTRAAVDAGIAPNDWQIGQTGKVVAPELYVAIGISGAIQHLAGMKDSRVIVAINKDAGAPIFDFATYGLVGDLYEIVPQLIEALGSAGTTS